jgi:methanogenic corrinoid protein MtbC1
MDRHVLQERYEEDLLAGKRRECRNLVHEAIADGIEPYWLYTELVWKSNQKIEKLSREDQINQTVLNMATRTNRLVLDQLQAQLPDRKSSKDKTIVVCSADGETEELGGQIYADLFEADGWTVYFVGGGVPNDEIVTLVNSNRPDLLLVFGARPSGVPVVKRLIDQIREVNAVPTMSVMLSGGVFDRAEGLWDEISADLYAPGPVEAVETANNAEVKVHACRNPSGVKRRRRQRPPLLRESA